jgi:hypothetical protein
MEIHTQNIMADKKAGFCFYYIFSPENGEWPLLKNHGNFPL